MTTDTHTHERNLELTEARNLLETQHAAKYDLVAHSSNTRYEDGDVWVLGNEGWYTMEPTGQFEDGISTRLEIPRKYLRRLRDDAITHLDYTTLDANVNHWLKRSDRNWFIRGFSFDGPGIARAFLSDRYNCIDHLDALFATLDGIAATGITGIQVDGVDLSERRLRVKITSPSIAAAVPGFLKDYKSPFSGQTGRDLPLIYAGLVLSNSETGSGAFQIAPHITVQVCKNGMTRTTDALRKVHLGERMDQGRIEWSRATRHANIDLIKSQATDAVTTFLSEAYITEVADELEEAAGHQLENPMKAIEVVSKQMRYSDDEKDQISAFFISGGDTTAGGLVNAVTAYAQTVTSADRAAELEEQAFDVLAVALRN